MIDVAVFVLKSISQEPPMQAETVFIIVLALYLLLIVLYALDDS